MVVEPPCGRSAHSRRDSAYLDLGVPGGGGRGDEGGGGYHWGGGEGGRRTENQDHVRSLRPYGFYSLLRLSAVSFIVQFTQPARSSAHQAWIR